MKANELMIGDWVRQQGCTLPTKVAGVTANKIHTIWADGSKHAKDEYYFDPIPLNPEILGKNGFEKYEMYHTLYEKQVCIEYYWYENRLEIQPYGGDAWIRLSPIYNVHELQHALRLCGLTELAENFKIE